jgi:hypothetical protein
MSPAYEGTGSISYFHKVEKYHAANPQSGGQNTALQVEMPEKIW